MLNGLWVGNTRYQNKIFVHLPIDEEERQQNFDKPEEFFDCYALFNYLAIRERRKDTNSILYAKYSRYSEIYEEQLTEFGALEECKVELGIIDAFKLRDYGKSLALPEFQTP